ncbi:sensor histidine kinase [Paenibacillus sp. N3.4]|uniref:cache domain-containing sensor histidine kinase n=1 Tax=Paenibacillus sp. N3.4 TaxID=2603222 RepID=UPI0011C817C9|nr:sensor histidine kinase [Paenibacillus sp. N3.4]TXK84444.1 sensor histidine kinase [Paenibacillus sp. N3.4]
MTSNPFKRFGIDWLLFGGFAMLIFILVSIMTLFNSSYTTRQSVESVSFYQQKLLNRMGDEINNQIKFIEQTASTASLNNDLQQFLFSQQTDIIRFQDMKNTFSNMVYTSSFIKSISIYIEDPKLTTDIYSPVQILDFERLKQEVWYPMIASKQQAWIPEHPVQSYIKNKTQMISFTKKIVSDSGQVYGIIMLNASVAGIQKTMKSESEDVSRLLIDNEGSLITSIGSRSESFYANHYKQFANQLVRQSGYKRIQLHNDNDQLMVWSNFEYSGWSIIELTPWERVTESSVKSEQVSIYIGCIALVLALVFALLLSRGFTKPLRLLIKKMNQFSLEKPSARLPSDYNNEFGSLFQGYTNLMDRIGELYVSLEHQYRLRQEVEVKALQAMINPHFLYNTLDQINWMAIQADQSDISRAISLLGRMFRIGLSKGEGLIQVSEEILYTECYLTIQQIRWGDNLRVVFDIDAECTDFYVPKLTLQPFIENAIMHGFNGRRTGHIHISLQKDDHGILIQIIDNGRGLKADWDQGAAITPGGYGIKNVKERIAVLYGLPFGIEMDNFPAGGTRVVIRLPIIKSRP